ncbi:MAG: lipopolysaccharide heptosyltransferase family protein [Planctomycetota bacterium]|nr:MAG: lipopolysaccharide heptosyltransferase family protein [Planctomycetota bacterium]
MDNSLPCQWRKGKAGCRKLSGRVTFSGILGMDLQLPPNPRVLFLRMSALGDLVFALPALQALRHHLPQARIEWLVEDRCAGLLQSHPGPDELLIYPRGQWKQAQGFRGRRRALATLLDHLLQLRGRPPYDLILDFQGNAKSALHLLFARGRHSFGFDKPAAREGAQRFVAHRIADPGRVHRTERDLSLVRALGYQGPAPPPVAWELDRQAKREVDLRLGHFLSTPEAAREDGPLVLLHTEVTDYGRDKAWPPSRWLQISRALVQACGARVLLLWTPADRSQVLAKVEASEGCCGLAPPTPTLDHLMAVTDRASLVLGTDSGPVHLAAHRGSPVLALFGPTDPERYAPYGPRVRCLYALADGQEPPPRDRSGPSPLMAEISVEEVLNAALEILAE